MHRILNSLIAVTLLVTITGPVTADASDISFDRSMEMFDAELNLRVLKRLSEKGFFVSPQLVDHFMERYNELATKMKKNQIRDIESIDGWRAEVAKVQKAEKVVLRDVFNKWLNKQLKEVTAAKGDDKDGPLKLRQIYKQHQDELNTLISNDSKKSVIIHYLKVLDRNPSPKTAYITEYFRDSATEVYRGNVNRDQLIRGIVDFEKQRMNVEASLQALEMVNKWSTRMEKLWALQESPSKFALQESRQVLVNHLKKRFPDAPIKELNDAVNEGIQLIQTANATYDKLKELKNNKNLKAHPQTVKMAQQFAVISAVINYSIIKLKKLPAAKALGPLLDVISFYGEALGLVPAFAQNMGAHMSKREQGIYGRYGANSTWVHVFNQIKGIDGTGLHGTKLMDATGIQITYDKPTKRYFLVVNKTVNRKGYEELTEVEYLRLERAVSAERIVWAPKETSNRFGDYWLVRSDVMWRAFTGENTTSPFSQNASASYISDLKKNIKKNPFTDQQLIDLAHNRKIKYKGRKKDVEDFVYDAEIEIEYRSTEVAVREALGEYKKGTETNIFDSYYNFREPGKYTTEASGNWDQFHKMLKNNRVPLTTRQISSLFRAYHMGSRTLAEKIIKKKVRERAIQRLGIPMVGVPLVTIPSSAIEDVDTIGSKKRTARIEATIITGELAPGRQVKANVIWDLPSWVLKPWALGAAGQKRTQSILLSNGLQKVYYNIAVPKNVKVKSFTVKVVVNIPPDETHDNTIKGKCTGHFNIEKMSDDPEKKKRDKPVKYKYVLKKGFDPKLNPQEKSFDSLEGARTRAREKGRKFNSISIAEISETSASIHEKNGDNADWNFELNISKTPPTEINPGETFELGLKGTASGSKMKFYHGGCLGIKTKGFHLVENSGRTSRIFDTYVSVGRIESKHPKKDKRGIVVSDNVKCKFMLKDSSQEEISISFHLLNYGEMSRYVYERVPIGDN